ncbi:MAG TPA: PepSY domain-containing protein [Gammaproteobacteria bacterium]|nr:PepSY domain-containing protein [Gammaproteobacteria bacterium]
MQLRIKHWLVVTHRWLGVTMCLLFALWFATGIIMMYVEYPELTEDERLAQRPALVLTDVDVTPAEAVAGGGLTGPVAGLTLSMLGDRPAYEMSDAVGSTAVVFADDGQRFAGTDEGIALGTVRASGFLTSPAVPTYDGVAEMDQWTVSEVLNPHRPLHRVQLQDAAGTVLYVSDNTGQIVRDTDRSERAWNWLGSTIHWIYPYQLRRHRSLWVDVVVYISIVGIISVVTGAILGFMRLRVRPRYPTGSISPFRGMLKWHHLLGLVSLIFVSTFIFSGLMSMTPWGIFDPDAPLEPQLARYTGGELRGLDAATVPEDLTDVSGVKEFEWRQIDGVTHLVAKHAADRRSPLVAGLARQAAVDALRERVERAAPNFLPDARVVSTEVLEEYDDYYYTRHNRYRPLPVYRVRFDDRESSWYHVDLLSGALITRETDATRLGRWLFNGLHSLDFVWLTRLGAVWDLTVIVLSIAGFAFAVTSVVIGVRRVF